MFKISQHLFEKSIRPDRILDGLRFHSISTLCSEVRQYAMCSYWRHGLDTVGGGGGGAVGPAGKGLLQSHCFAYCLATGFSYLKQSVAALWTIVSSFWISLKQRVGYFALDRSHVVSMIS